MFRALRLWRKTFLTKAVRLTYSQFGEDMLLRELIRKDYRGVYLDVGCYHPKRFSNTYWLSRRGWRGINVDVEADKVQCFRLARPRDTNVVAAVSDRPHRVKVIGEGNYALESRIVPVENDHVESGQNVLRCRTLEDIVESTPFADRRIDLLSIDVEGNDLAALRSINLRRRKPAIIIVEDHRATIEDVTGGEIYAHLRQHGYLLYGWTRPSLIFIVEGSSEIFRRACPAENRPQPVAV